MAKKGRQGRSSQLGIVTSIYVYVYMYVVVFDFCGLTCHSWWCEIHGMLCRCLWAIQGGFVGLQHFFKNTDAKPRVETMIVCGFGTLWGGPFSA